MLSSSNALPNSLAPLLSLLFLCLSPTVFWALSLSLCYHLFSLPGLGSFYCLKGTLLTTHICPFIILRGLFYSCPSTVADADQCHAMLNRSEKKKLQRVSECTEGGGRLTPASLVIENMWRREREREREREDGGEKKRMCRVRYIRTRTDGGGKKNSKEEEEKKKT